MRPFVLLVLLATAVMARPQSGTLRDQRPAGQGQPGYTLEASYPIFGAGVSPKVNQACAALLQKDVKQFKQFYQESARGRFEWTYHVRYSVESDTPEVISVLYTVTSRQDGAHPRFYFLAQAFSPKSGRPWQLERSSLSRLSAYCIADLKKQIHPQFGSAGDDQIERGAGPQMENFKSVLPTPKGLKVYFPTDQIGPNLLGTRVVTIPYAALGR